MKSTKRSNPKPHQTRKKNKRRSKGGIIWLIVFTLLSSAALRLGGQNGFAIAEEVEATEVVMSTDEQCRDEVRQVLERLRERERILALKENELANKAAALDASEIQIRRNLQTLSRAEDDLRRMMALSSEAAETDLEQLTSVYENMKPKKAAEVFAEMDPGFAAGFLSRMRSDAAAAILANLDAEIAYSISVVLAGRNANAPTE